MRSLIALTKSELRLYGREPAAVFFTLAFPLLILFVFGGIFGNEPDPQFGGRGSVDVSVPGYIAQVIGTVGFFGLPITLAAYREQGILRRLRATPVSPLTVLGAQVVVNVLFAAIGVGLLVAAGRLAYGLVPPASPLGVAAAILLSALAFAAVGFVIAGLAPTARAAQAVGSALFFPQLFLSGASFPRELMPDNIRRFADLLPLSQVVILVQQLWSEGTWAWPSLTALVAVMIAGTAVAGRLFRWE